VESSPAVADGMVFIGSDDGKVYAFGLPLPALAVTAAASPTVIYSGGASKINVTVSSAGAPISGATISLTSDKGGSFSDVTDFTNGTLTATFIGPTVTTPTVCTITATASKSGYTSSQGQTTVTVQPLPPPALTVSSTASPTTISSGETSTIKVTVTSGGTPVSGAAISLTSNKGGTFSTVTDYANGTYTATFTAPTVAASTICTITANASKSGYSSNITQTQLTVNPSAHALQLIWIIIIITIIIIVAIIVGAFFAIRRTRKPKL
jgi:adhesin/invasin